MSKHIPAREQPLKAPPHSGESPVTTPPAPARPGPDKAPPGPPAAAASRPPAPEGSAVTDEQIAVRAYEIWLERGRPDGADREHWSEAEHQLRRHLSNPHLDTTSVSPSR